MEYMSNCRQSTRRSRETVYIIIIIPKQFCFCLSSLYRSAISIDEGRNAFPYDTKSLFLRNNACIESYLNTTIYYILSSHGREKILSLERRKMHRKFIMIVIMYISVLISRRHNCEHHKKCTMHAAVYIHIYTMRCIESINILLFYNLNTTR